MIKAAGRLIAILSGAWFIFYIYKSNALPLPILHENYPWIAGGIVIYWVAFLLVASAWMLLLKDLGCSRASLVASAAVLFVSQLGKYIPGNVGHHIGRVALAKIFSCGSDRVIVSIALELLLATLIVVVMAIPIVFELTFSLKSELHMTHNPVLYASLAGLLAIAFLALRKPIIRSIAILAKRIGINDISHYSIHLRTLALSSSMYIINNILMGFALYILLSRAYGVTSLSFLYLSGAYAASWLIGFVTPGSPAGLGVREVALVAILSPFSNPEAAAGSAALLRIVTTLSEASIFLIGLTLMKTAHYRNLSSRNHP